VQGFAADKISTHLVLKTNTQKANGGPVSNRVSPASQSCESVLSVQKTALETSETATQKLALSEVDAVQVFLSSCAVPRSKQEVPLLLHYC
jgi:hypothetical protein